MSKDIGRHIFGVKIVMDFIAPRSITPKAIEDKVMELVKTYLDENFKVEVIYLNGANNQTTEILELKDKMEDLR